MLRAIGLRVVDAQPFRNHNGFIVVRAVVAPMTSFTLKNLPAKLLRSLRAAAEQDRRSLNQEITHLLELALQLRERSRARVSQDVEAQLAAWRELAGKWQSDLDPEVEADRIMSARTAGRKVEL